MVIQAAVALIVVGVIVGVLAPPFGFAPALVGLVLLLLYAVVGIGKKAAG